MSMYVYGFSAHQIFYLVDILIYLTFLFKSKYENLSPEVNDTSSKALYACKTSLENYNLYTKYSYHRHVILKICLK